MRAPTVSGRGLSVTGRSVSYGPAIPDDVVDDFEWTGPIADRYSTVVDYEINTNTPVLYDSYSLKQTAENIDAKAFSLPADTDETLPVHFGPDDIPRTVWGYQTAKSAAAFCFGASGPNNCLMATLSVGVDEIRIGTIEGGTRNDANTTNVSVSAGTWYGYQIKQWDTDGNITFALLDTSKTELATVSMTDTFNNDERGIGFISRASSNLHHWDGQVP